MRDLTGKMARVFQKTASLCRYQDTMRWVDLQSPDFNKQTGDDSRYIHESSMVAQFLKAEGSVTVGEQFIVNGNSWEVGQAIAEDDTVLMFHAHPVL